MTAVILHLPPIYRIAWSFEGLDGFVQFESGKDWTTRDEEEANWRMQQLRNRFAGRIIFWLEKGGIHD